MITVQAKPFATLRRLFPDLDIGEAIPVDLPDDATIAQLLHTLDVPDEKAKVIFVNGVVQKKEHTLSDGDEIGIFPPVGGG